MKFRFHSVLFIVLAGITSILAIYKGYGILIKYGVSPFTAICGEILFLLSIVASVALYTGLKEN